MQMLNVINPYIERICLFSLQVHFNYKVIVIFVSLYHFLLFWPVCHFCQLIKDLGDSTSCLCIVSAWSCTSSTMVWVCYTTSITWSSNFASSQFVAISARFCCSIQLAPWALLAGRTFMGGMTFIFSNNLYSPTFASTGRGEKEAPPLRTWSSHSSS